MQNLNHCDVIARYPEVQSDRHGLSFPSQAAPSEIARALSCFGVVMLRGALSADTLLTCAESFRRFTHSLGRKSRWPGRLRLGGDERPDAQWSGGEKDIGSWHKLWVVRDGNQRPAAAVISALLKSWAWPVVEEISGTTDIAILLRACMARHGIDKHLGVGAHQDAKVVAPDIPFSIWIPFHDVTPGQNSGLGFVVQPPDFILPTLPHNDVGSDYVLSRLEKVWLPTYRAGDMTIHTKYSPHFTTGYGTLSDRYSLEIRAMPRDTAPSDHLDPALYIGRRNGVPTITGTGCLPGTAARDFLASSTQLAKTGARPAKI
jgi:hypothetical protein